MALKGYQTVKLAQLIEKYIQKQTTLVHLDHVAPGTIRYKNAQEEALQIRDRLYSYIAELMN